MFASNTHDFGLFTARFSTPADDNLPYYSHSIIEGINTCPRWGHIRYIQRKYYASQYRQMALEAGSAMHEVFAAFRITQLAHPEAQNMPALAMRNAARVFGRNAPLVITDVTNKSFRDAAMKNCFNALEHSRFYDDPDDKIRTMANMEVTTIRYVDEQIKSMDNNDIWYVPGDDLAGIEIPFSIVISDKSTGTSIRYIGTIDGICYYRNPNESYIRIDENKTAARLDNAWRESFRVKTQPTGYMVAATLLVGAPVEHTRIIGVKVKQTNSHEDYLQCEESRSERGFDEWYNTLMFTHNILTEPYRKQPLAAPQFTHSCNRYFRPCGLIDLCDAKGDLEDAMYIYEGMVEAPLSPSEQAIIGGGKHTGDR